MSLSAAGGNNSAPHVPRVSGDKTKYADMQKDVNMFFCISAYMPFSITSQL